MRQCTDGMQMGFTEGGLRIKRQQAHGQETEQRGMGHFQMRRLKYKRRGTGQKIWRGDRTKTSTSSVELV